MQTPQDVYLDNATYKALRAEITRLVSELGVFDADTKVVEALGEIGGVWPRSVIDDADAA